jgi:transposase
MSDYLPYLIDQPFLMPPDLREWLPEDDIAYFVSDTIDDLDLSSILGKNSRVERRGRPAYHPTMMTKLILYGFVAGVVSSRKIEAATYRQLDFRVLCANLHPDHDSIAAFRKTHFAELAALFIQVLKLCDEAKMISMGAVSVDGTKIIANASLRANRSARSLAAEEARIEDLFAQQAQALLEEADRVDAEEDEKYGKGNTGDRVPVELKDRTVRKAFIKKALDAMKEQEAEQAAQQKASADKGKPSKSDAAKSGAPQIADGTQACLKINVTDPDSRIMRDGATKSFVQAYNAQAVVDTEHQIILAAEITQQANDKQQLVPMVVQAIENVGRPPVQVLADAGYYSKAQVTDELIKGIDLLVPPDRACTTCETASAPAPPEPSDSSAGSAFEWYSPPVTVADQMRAKLTTPEGRADYGKRGQSIEPVFGQIKEGGGFRRFLTRGKENVGYEWSLICLASNLKKLFRFLRKKDEDQNPAPKALRRGTCVRNSGQMVLEVA